MISERRSYTGRNRFRNKCMRSDVSDFKSFINNSCHPLPPPPDIRRVEIASEADPALPSSQPHSQFSLEQQVIPEQRQEPITVQPKRAGSRIEISNLNTTLIGDYISAVFPEYDSKWLVQAIGNATFASTFDNIMSDNIIVNRKYIFLQLGGNQIRSANKESVFNALLKVVLAIREKNKESRVFVVGVLPCPVEDVNAKPLVMMFNRRLLNAVERVDEIIHKVKFIPAHLSFIDGQGPKLHLFNEDDKLTLNSVGAALLQAVLFKHAGFVRNN